MNMCMFNLYIDIDIDLYLERPHSRFLSTVCIYELLRPMPHEDTACACA